MVVVMAMQTPTGKYQLQSLAASSSRLPTVGFATQLRLKDPANSGLNQQNFDAGVRSLSRQLTGKKIVSVGVTMDEAFPRTNTATTNVSCDFRTPAKSVNCDPKAIDQWRDSLQKAKKQGFTVRLSVAAPGWITTYSDFPAEQATWRSQVSTQEYATIAANAQKILAQRLGGSVDVWNLYNESNLHTFDTYEPLDPNDSAAYLASFQTVFRAGAEAIKKADRGAVITHSVGGIWPEGSEVEKWSGFVNTLQPSVDQLSFTVYPNDQDMNAIYLPERIQEITNQYGKPVAISELGFCSNGAHKPELFTAAQQAKYLPMFVQQAMKSSAQAVIVYQYQDDEISWETDSCQKSYGVVTRSQQSKPAFNEVLTAMNGKKAQWTAFPLQNCQVKYEDTFDTGSAITWDKWFAANTLHPIESGAVHQVKGDWMISRAELPAKLDVFVDVRDLAVSQDLGYWAAANLEFLNAENTPLFTVSLIREQWGYSYKLQRGAEQKVFFAGPNFDHVRRMRVIRRENNLYLVQNGLMVGYANDFFLSTEAPAKVSLSTNGSDNTTVDVRYENFSVQSCQ